MATLLIEQDLHVSKAEAYGIWARSKDFGHAFHGNIDDGTIDDINNKNIKNQVLFPRCPGLFKAFLMRFTHFSALGCAPETVHFHLELEGRDRYPW